MTLKRMFPHRIEHVKDDATTPDVHWLRSNGITVHVNVEKIKI